jgi:hypothetical protein
MITECRSIYWNSTTRSVQVGDFLYQNQAQTIPASAGYYSLNSNSSWAQCDAEGLVLNTGICPNIFTSSFGYVGTNGNVGIASISGSICGFDGVQPGISGSDAFTNPIVVMTPSPTYVNGIVWNAQSFITPTNFTESEPFTNISFFNGNSWNFTGTSNTNAGALLFNNQVLVSPNTLQSTLPILQNQPYTIDLWFKTNTDTSRNGAVVTLFSRQQSNNTTEGLAGYAIRQNAGGAGRLQFTMIPANSQGGVGSTVTTDAAYPGTDWKNLTITIDGSNNTSGVRLYLNGQSIATQYTGTIIPNMLETNGTSISPQIGNIDWGDPIKDSTYYVGRIGRLAMYNSNANSLQVASNYLFFSSSYTN